MDKYGQLCCFLAVVCREWAATYHVRQPVLTLGAEALVYFGFVRIFIVPLILETMSSRRRFVAHWAEDFLLAKMTGLEELLLSAQKTCSGLDADKTKKKCPPVEA